MDLHGEPQLLREVQLRLERRPLRRFVGARIVVVEADLPHRDALFVGGRLLERFHRLPPEMFEFGRVYAHGEERARMLSAKFRVPRGMGERIGGEDDGLNARGRNFFPFGGKIVALLREMGVDVDHRTVAPHSTARSGETSERRPAPSSAQRIMPSESTPHSLAGARFVTTTTFFPTISSGV